MAQTTNMQWSKLRSRVEALWAPAVADHVALHVTRYRRAFDEEGRAWITWDREQVASFESIPFMSREGTLRLQFEELGVAAPEASLHATETARDEGRFALWDFWDAVGRYPDLSVDDALDSEDPIIRGLAMLDRRLGRRRLDALVLRTDEQPFVKRLFALRQAAEIRIQTRGMPT